MEKDLSEILFLRSCRFCVFLQKKTKKRKNLLCEISSLSSFSFDKEKEKISIHRKIISSADERASVVVSECR